MIVTINCVRHCAKQCTSFLSYSMVLLDTTLIWHFTYEKTGLER